MSKFLLPDDRFLEILKAASSKYLLNDVIAGQSDPIYRLLLSVSDLNSSDRRNFDTKQDLQKMS